jgi:hypothetical protein
MMRSSMTATRQHIQSLERYAAQSGARLIRGELPDSVHGQVAEGLITLSARLSPEQELLALVHELTHWLAHRPGCEHAAASSRTVYEYEAEAVEALVMARLGVRLADAVPGEDAAPTDDLLSSSVTRVVSTSRRICQALGLETD